MEHYFPEIEILAEGRKGEKGSGSGSVKCSSSPLLALVFPCCRRFAYSACRVLSSRAVLRRRYLGTLHELRQKPLERLAVLPQQALDVEDTGPILVLVPGRVERRAYAYF